MPVSTVLTPDTVPAPSLAIMSPVSGYSRAKQSKAAEPRIHSGRGAAGHEQAKTGATLRLIEDRKFLGNQGTSELLPIAEC